MSLSVRTLVSLAAELTSALDLTTVSSPVSIGRQINFADGDGAGEADRIWTNRSTIAASGTDSLDLAGSLTDPFGASLSFGSIKGVLVAADSANTNNVVVSRPATNGVPLISAVSAGVPVKPGGVFLWLDPSAAGVAVTAGTGDLLSLVNSAAGSSVTYDIAIIGVAAS